MINWFNNPALLWSALLVLPLLALFMLRHRPVRKRVPSVLLWKGVAQMQVATSPFQRLRKSTSLILLLIALMLMVLALAGFKVPAVTTSSVPAIVVIDATASMGAASMAGTRLEQAIRLLPELKNEADLNIEKTLVWDGQMRDLSDKMSGGIRPADYGASVGSLRQYLKSIVRENVGRQVVLISDTRVEGIDGLTSIGVGKASINTAITTASIQEVSPTQTDLFFGLELFHATDFEVTLMIERLKGDSFEIVDSSRMKLTKDLRTSYHLEDAKDGLYRATIKTEDSFALDNTAWLRVSSLPVIDVVMHGDVGESVSRVTKSIEESMGLVRIVETEQSSRAHLTTHLFADAASTGTETLLPSVYFAPDTLPEGVKVGPSIGVPTARTQRIENPLWRGVGSSELAVTEVFPANTSRWFSPLMTADDKPVLALFKKQNSGLNDLLFLTPTDDKASGFTETVAFLVFWANWYDYARRCTDPLPRGRVQTHEALTLWAPGQSSAVSITHVDSDEQTTLENSQLFTAERAGLYVCEGLQAPAPTAFGVSLLDASESSLPVADQENLSTVLADLSTKESDIERDVQMAPWFLLLGCGIFLAEWLLYRRKFQSHDDTTSSAKNEVKPRTSKATV
ncbi:BatA domain-containing protein [Planctomycetota bacterium]|nr:BatA domain-containing protein [Planctomycetota bacterium]